MDDDLARCWHYDAIDKDPKIKTNCPNCSHWGWTKCEDETLLMNKIHGTENLMRHDGYRRGSGGIRQTRRG